MTSHSRIRVAELIGDKIIRQDLPPGRSVGETALANEFGLSRTPIREALLGLESEGLVRAQRGRGFIVQPMSVAEAREIFPIIGTLERLAVESSGPPPAELVDRLHAINTAMAAAESPHERMKLDAAWHRAIVSGCGNPRLISLLAGLKPTALRYEYAYQKVTRLRDQSLPEHDEIIALMTKDPAGSGQAIEAHWLRGMKAVVEMMVGAQ